MIGRKNGWYEYIALGTFVVALGFVTGVIYLIVIPDVPRISTSALLLATAALMVTASAWLNAKTDR